ncbi:unnamed protein product, partial [Mesorhabditis belari]|uniref:Ground-like domain-containing protein n=1 Tax=Mesorhabditis belari TaxID=2138241 RepID=A0AAF3J3H1_9BILA
MIYRTLVIFVFLRQTQAFLNLFGGGGCGCGCAPTPSCAPPMPSCAPPSPCGGGGLPPSPYYSAGPSYSPSAYPSKDFASQLMPGPSFPASSIPQIGPQISQPVAQSVQPSVINEVSVPTQQLSLSQQPQSQEQPQYSPPTNEGAPVGETNSVQQQYIAPAVLAPSGDTEAQSANDYQEETPANPINPPAQSLQPAPEEPQNEPQTGAEYDEETIAKRQTNFDLAEQNLDLVDRNKEYEDAGENTGEYSSNIAKALKKAIRMKVLRRSPLKKQILREVAEVVPPRVEVSESLSLDPRTNSPATETTSFDPKCNSEVLRKCILENVQQSTATSKRKIQKAAVDAIGGRVDVICSMATFSYIVNTELYCEAERNGITCFAFRQAGNQ